MAKILKTNEFTNIFDRFEISDYFDLDKISKDELMSKVIDFSLLQKNQKHRMDKKKLNEKIQEGLNTLYAEAKTVYPRSISWDELNTEEVANAINDEGCFWTGFYISKNKFDELVNQLSKGTRSSWRWPRKTEFDENHNVIPDPEWDEYKALYEHQIGLLEDKKITRKQLNAWENEMAKKYGMDRRNYDKEYIEFNVSNYCPSFDESHFAEMQNAYNSYANGDMSAHDAAKNAVKRFEEYMVDEEYEQRKDIYDSYGEDNEEFKKTFLDKDNIEKGIKYSIENRISNIERDIVVLKRLWDDVFSKNK